MLKGLAYSAPFLQDIANLNCTWWYDWGCNNLGNSQYEYVPMMRSGLETCLPQSYDGFCLIFNEPENKEPNGYPLSAAEMVAHYVNAQHYYPQTKFIVGGVGWNKVSILTSFKALCIKQGIPLPYGWAAHAYVYRSANWTVSKIKAGLAKFKTLGGPVWVTEYGVPSNNKYTLPDFKVLTTWITAQTWIERYAAYTNRQSGTQPWEIGKGCNLIDYKTGDFTQVGQYYAGI